MAKPIEHLLDVYSAWLHLATDEKAWTKLQAKHSGAIDKAPDSLGSCTFATWNPDQPGITVPHLFLWVDIEAHRDSTIALVETCAHEATHAASHLLKHYGHKIRRSDEPFAYLVAWIAQWMFEHCVDKIAA